MWNLDAGHSRVMSSGKAGCGFEGGGKREASREATRPQHVTLKEAATNLKALLLTAEPLVSYKNPKGSIFLCPRIQLLGGCVI